MAKKNISIPVGTIAGENTKGRFTVVDILSQAETDKLWQENFHKTPPHDCAYNIEFKCGKNYWTLKTQVYKCKDVGWRTCYNCTKTKDQPCRWDQPNSHPIHKTPERNMEIPIGTIIGDLEVVGFGYNAKRHNYYEFKCHKCGEGPFYRMTPSNESDIKSCRCPYCSGSQSRGAAAVEAFLKDNNFKYKKEYTFPDCTFNGKLRFDFAVFNEKDQLNCLIEYDGEQHFNFIPFWHGTEEGLALQQWRDEIKNNYCKDHSIKLIRIPYTKENDIDMILTKVL